MEKQEYPYLIEGTLRHQQNIITAKTNYGNMFSGKIINTNYFKDDKVVPTLVCSNDISLILGKPRYPEKFTDNEYKINLIDRHNVGLFSIEITKHDNEVTKTREIIRDKLIKEIEKTIDEKVSKWMETKQTKFKINEKDKIERFNTELIQFLNSLRDTSKFPTTLREQVETSYIGHKITCIVESAITNN